MTATMMVEVTPEDFARQNKKLIQMLHALERRAPDRDELTEKGADDIEDFLDKLEKEVEEAVRGTDNDPNYASLLRYGLHTRNLSDDIMGSKFYAYEASLIVKGSSLGYIHRRDVRRSTKGRTGNPNLVVNYITEKGRELLAQLRGET